MCQEACARDKETTSRWLSGKEDAINRIYNKIRVNPIHMSEISNQKDYRCITILTCPQMMSVDGVFMLTANKLNIFF